MLADDIREYVCHVYIEPARKGGEREVRVRAGDVHKEMGLCQRIPAVCSAIGSNKFQDEYRVRLVGREGPTNGSNVYFTFEV